MKSSIPHPWCAKCNKPVDSYLVAHSVDSFGTKIRAWCHGEKDDCELSGEFLFIWNSFDFTLSSVVAFQPKDDRLPAPTPALPEHTP